MKKDEAFELAEEILRAFPDLRLHEFTYNSHSGVGIKFQDSNDTILFIQSRQNWDEILMQRAINREWQDKQGELADLTE